MAMIDKLRKINIPDWLSTLGILMIYLIDRGYTLGWDDQNLEIPLLKNLINPSLFQGDYYVESVRANFCSFMYPLLAKFITVAQIPIVYFILYLVSRYFLFFWMYKFWQLIAREKHVAFLFVIFSLYLGRIPQFYYRTFSHQEFSLIFVMAGLYFFYKERFVLASAIFGLGSNFHILYNFFPMLYLGTYLLRLRRPFPWTIILKSFFAFLLFSLPVIAWFLRIKFFAEDSKLAVLPMN